MVTPHSEWDDTEAGYRNDDTLVSVRPISIQWAEANGKPKSGEGYEAHVDYGYNSSRSIATFADSQTAWKFASLLTHYLDRRGPPQPALSKLTHSNGGMGEEGDWEPPTIIEDLSASETLRKIAGRHSYIIDKILNDLDLLNGLS